MIVRYWIKFLAISISSPQVVRMIPPQIRCKLSVSQCSFFLFLLVFPLQGFLVPSFHLSRFSESFSDRSRTLVNSVTSSLQIHRSRPPFRDPTGVHLNAYHGNEKYCIRHQSFCIYPIFFLFYPLL
jgi:hypothetical protein